MCIRDRSKATQVISEMQSQLEAAGISPSPSISPQRRPTRSIKRNPIIGARLEGILGPSKSPPGFYASESPVRTRTPKPDAPFVPSSKTSIFGKDGRLDLRSARKIMTDAPPQYDLDGCDF
eukprot:TRINITY_DN28769_c0_g1_i1.p1 TRINITY_DN28769_c0_g1~~TRINITY_DN28769_c0_g1_i1.p1  ORF type:complete len:121 (-),score=17.32 TRINITY_DN28769_c0_g1_i1:48-410(-)